MSNKVLVAGVGMVKFTKPGKSEMYDVMGGDAAALAMIAGRLGLEAPAARRFLATVAEVEAVQGLLVVVVGAGPCLPAEGEAAAGHLR